MDYADAFAAARLLVAHRRSGVRLEALPEALVPQTEADGYQIQDLTVTCFGERVVAWKIGATHPNSQASLGTSGPVAARLYSTGVIEGSATLPDRLLIRGLEAEYAFLMDADLPPRDTPYSREEVINAVASVHPSIEVVDTRFTAVQAGATVIADSVGDSSWIYGEGTENVRDLDMRNAQVIMEVNGEAVVAGNGTQVLGDPVTSLMWLANDHARQREGLRAGQFVTTGSCTGLYKAPEGCSARATFAGLGEVSVQFEA
ncbi:MAG: 2-keto-4-pentenoate hydratase [Pseudomonadota bacterium]